MGYFNFFFEVFIVRTKMKFLTVFFAFVLFISQVYGDESPETNKSVVEISKANGTEDLELSEYFSFVDPVSEEEAKELAEIEKDFNETELAFDATKEVEVEIVDNDDVVQEDFEDEKDQEMYAVEVAHEENQNSNETDVAEEAEEAEEEEEEEDKEETFVAEEEDVQDMEDVEGEVQDVEDVEDEVKEEEEVKEVEDAEDEVKEEEEVKEEL